MTVVAPQKPGAEVSTPEELRLAIAEAWPKAKARWAPFVLLADPLNVSSGVDLAAIDLGTRQIYLGGETLLSKGLLDCTEALLAHEIGHHLRHPGSLAVAARMRLLERTLLPVEGLSFVNLFDDLLINEHLGHQLQGELIRLYQAFHNQPQWGADSVFLFYMAVYEELWQLPPGTLLGPAHAMFAARHPNYRADAQLVAQNVFSLGPNVYTQFLYFLSMALRYLELPSKLVNGDPLRCGRGEPTPGDWADALTPSQRERAAIERAAAEGWISREQAGRMTDRDALDRRVAGLPGQATANAEMIPEVMAAYYRLQAERYLVRPPPQEVLGEAVVPTTLEEWDLSDPLPQIDWTATLVLRGDRLGGLAPLRRERLADYEGYDVPFWQPRIEIYLDVSGSMPDPRTTLNAMTLAAQILAVAAIRAGGWARALVYSGDHVSYWTWCRSEVEMSRFLMHYIGGGTNFPFEVLASSVRECGNLRPVRVIISDSDFDANYDSKAQNPGIFAGAAEASSPLVSLMHAPTALAVARYRAAGSEVVAVNDLEAFPKMAAELSRAP